MNCALFFFARHRFLLYEGIPFVKNLRYHRRNLYSFLSESRVLLSNTSKSVEWKNRYYCTANNPDKQTPDDPKSKLPSLMNFPELTWPVLTYSIKNFFLTYFIIKPYMDRDFDVSDFVRGSKKAVEVVSNILSGGQLKDLEGLVSKDIIPTIKDSISKMSLSQREQLALREEDIYFSFPYQIGIIFNEEDDDSDRQKRFVEITMVHHVLKGLKGMKDRGDDVPINIGVLPEYRDKLSIVNYRYIKEFTKGVDSDWTINLLNHFKPADFVNESK